METNEITSKVIGIAYKVHSSLGPGLLESSYKECLFYKLGKEGLFVEKEKPIPLCFEQVRLDCGYRLDLLVERKVVLELKAVEALNEIHLAQVLTYLKLGGFKVGLLINFNVLHLREGIRRVVYHL
jgi:GxxExxY protein